MGGGGAMRAATKVAGIGVISSGLRGTVAEYPATAAASRVTRPVSAMISSASDDVKAGVMVGDVQRPCWELDDWEFAGAVDDDISEPSPRVVFGGAPSFQEAREATSELKDALEIVYLSANGGSHADRQQSVSSVLANSETLETKACVSSDTSGSAVPKHAIQAFRFLSETPKAQSVVASITSDPNVWKAVLQNVELQEFLRSQKTVLSSPDAREPVLDTNLLYKQSQMNSDVPSEHGENGGGNFFQDRLQNIKVAVVDMMSSLSGYFQNFFGGQSLSDVSKDAEGSSTFVGKAVGVSMMGLVVMAIMVVVLKRG